MNNRDLVGYLPLVVKEFGQMKGIMETEQPELRLAWTGAEHALQDNFVRDATQNGVARWEAVLGIFPRATAALSERRMTILARLNEQLPYTFRTLQNQLEMLCGEKEYSVFLEHEAYHLYVEVGIGASCSYDDVARLLGRVLPANLLVTISVKYNQHETLTRHTHGYLKQFTHYDLRNEVLG